MKEEKRRFLITPEADIWTNTVANQKPKTDQIWYKACENTALNNRMINLKVKVHPLLLFTVLAHERNTCTISYNKSHSQWLF